MTASTTTTFAGIGARKFATMHEIVNPVAMLLSAACDETPLLSV